MPRGQQRVGIASDPVRRRALNQLQFAPTSPPLLGGKGRGKDGQEEQRRKWAHPGKIGVALLLLLAACGRPNRYVTAASAPAASADPGPAVGIDAVWVLERSGASPPDTVVTYRAGAGRTIVMRHGPPDNVIFAILEIPGDSARRGTSDSVTLRLSPSPGRYGVDLQSSDSVRKGTRLTFSYATHFQEPSDATAKYRTPAEFELNTAAGRLTGTNQFQFVVGDRPAADMIRFNVTGNGTWLLAARR